MDGLPGRNPAGSLGLHGLDNLTHENGAAVVTQTRPAEAPSNTRRQRNDVDERIVIVGEQQEITDAQTASSGGHLIGHRAQRGRVGTIAGDNVNLHDRAFRFDFRRDGRIFGRA